MIAKNLKYLRKIHSLSVKKMADRLGKNKQTYYSWERGASEPRISDLINITKEFRMPLKSLLTEDVDRLSNEM